MRSECSCLEQSLFIKYTYVNYSILQLLEGKQPSYFQKTESALPQNSSQWTFTKQIVCTWYHRGALKDVNAVGFLPSVWERSLILRCIHRQKYFYHAQSLLINPLSYLCNILWNNNDHLGIRLVIFKLSGIFSQFRQASSFPCSQ